MGEQRPVANCMLIAAIISRYKEARDWAHQHLTALCGEPILVSPEFEFRETDYYRATMGEGLIKQFLAFPPGSFDPANLATAKLGSNRLEREYLTNSLAPESRPLNIDPGYITEAKLVLATTKDRDHRIYLRDGIYAEVTLHWRDGGWKALRWTYPDYQRPDYHAFFIECRELLRRTRGN